MLVELAVKNLGVIPEARIPLRPGMVALTGETGAGKTMVVEALNLLLGNKADPSRVRVGADEAMVEGLFVVGDTEWVLRRCVPANGRSRAYVNGELATAANLAEIASALLELHGQHAQQALLQPRTQRDALDRFVGLDRSEFLAARRAVTAAREALAELGGDERSRARELDLCQFQVDEIDAVAPVVGEDDALAAEEELLASAVEHRRAAETASSLLSDDGSAGDLVARAAALIAESATFSAVRSRLVDAQAELADCGSELRRLAESIEPDDERLSAIRERRHLLVQLRRKYGATIEDVLAHREQVAARIHEIRTHDELHARRVAELEEAVTETARQGELLGEARRAGAPALARAVEEHLVELALAGARMEVVVADTPEHPGAGESVEFRLAANAGVEPAGLARVASGGELSRVMLALRLVLSEGPPTMVFDEVDAGIGGEAALSVGRSLAQLSAGRQVMVVTHLAQVAAHADQQVLVVKSQESGAAVTTAVELDDESRVVELSRMLSGTPGSDSARHHARELLDSVARPRAENQ